MQLNVGNMKNRWSWNQKQSIYHNR